MKGTWAKHDVCRGSSVRRPTRKKSYRLTCRSRRLWEIVNALYQSVSLPKFRWPWVAFKESFLQTGLFYPQRLYRWVLPKTWTVERMIYFSPLEQSISKLGLRAWTTNTVDKLAHSQESNEEWCQSVSQSVCLSVSLFVCKSVCLSLFSSVCRVSPGTNFKQIYCDTWVWWTEIMNWWVYSIAYDITHRHEKLLTSGVVRSSKFKRENCHINGYVETPADIYALGRRYANVYETTNIDPMSAQLQEFYAALSSLFQPYTDAYHGRPFSHLSFNLWALFDTVRCLQYNIWEIYYFRVVLFVL